MDIDYEKLATIARVGDDFHRELITTIIRQRDNIRKLENDLAGLAKDNKRLESENEFLIRQLEQCECESGRY